MQIYMTTYGLFLHRFARTDVIKNIFSVTCPKLWNALPLEIRKQTSLATFKTSVKKYYLSKQLNETRCMHSQQ